MLTRTGRTIAGGAAALTLGGILFGNWPAFGAGALLAILVSSGTLARAPHATRTVDRARIERGGRVRFALDVDVPRGVGVVEVHQHLPDEFELVEGSNFHVLTLGARKRRERHEFVVRVPKRGEWVLSPVRVKVLHPTGFAESRIVERGEPLTLVVEPRPLAARIPRDLRTRAKRPFPDGDLARMGVATNDFRELREYVPGDPPRRINWKATARRVGSGFSEVPLVNETEWEGKKCVWILVDGAPALSAGTNLEDAREHAADAALSLVEAYLRKGFQVGLSTARGGPVAPLRFGTGEPQVRRAREALARLREDTRPSLVEALDRDGATLHRARPLVVLVTRLAQADPDLRAAFRRIGALGLASGRNLVPGLVLDVEPPAAATTTTEEAVAALALERDRAAMRAAARAAGLRVADWRAGVEPLEAVLVRGRIA